MTHALKIGRLNVRTGRLRRYREICGRFGKTLWIFIAVIVVSMVTGFGGLMAQTPEIRFIYPGEGQAITAYDSAFVLGNVTPGAGLWINGVPVDVQDNGAFLAFLPVSDGPFVFRGMAVMSGDTVWNERAIQVPQRMHTFPLDSLGLDSSFVMPLDSVWLLPGDVLEVSCKGTPDCEAFFDIEGIAWGLPMAERRPEMVWLDKSAVFGELASDTGFVSGIYTGLYQVQAWDYGKAASIRFHLASGGDSIQSMAPGVVTIINSPVPRVGMLTGETVIARPAPGLPIHAKFCTNWISNINFTPS